MGSGVAGVWLMGSGVRCMLMRGGTSKGAYFLQVEAEIDQASQPPTVIRSGVVRTARKLFDGTVFPRRSP